MCVICHILSFGNQMQLIHLQSVAGYIYQTQWYLFLNLCEAIPLSYWPNFLADQKAKPGYGFDSLQIQNPTKSAKKFL